MRAPDRTRPGLALGATLLLQVVGSLCLAVPSVLAPAVAPVLGYGADRVGLFVGTAYLAAMASGLMSGGWVAQVGAVRVCQLALFAFGVGMLSVTSGHPLALLAAALVVGAGYGVINPTSSSLLNHHAPVDRRGLFFSVKQAGVPLGVALAGLLMPWGLVTIGWQFSLVALGGVCAAYGLSLLAVRGRLDAGSALVSHSADRSHALFRVLKDPELRRLSVSSFAFASSQLAFMTFLVSYLNLELGHSLALAAGVLAASQVFSTLARIGWGHAGDRWFNPGTLLGWLGIGAALSFVALAGLGLLPGARLPASPDVTSWLRVGVAVAASMFCALTAMGWNGVFFAELARRSKPGDLASVAGATQFVTFFGSMTGPVVFGEIIRHGGSYSAAFLLVAVLPLAAGITMVRANREAALPV